MTHANINISPTSQMVTYWGGTGMYPSDSPVQQYLDLFVNESMAEKIAPFVNNMTRETLEFGEIAMFWRKAFMYEKTIQAIQLGYTQVVLIADGCNGMVVDLAYRYPQVQFYCTDFNADLMDGKEAVIRGLGFTNVTCLHHDATQKGHLTEQLLSHGYDVTKKGFGTVEGLLYYIKKDEEIELFKEFLAFHPENRLIVDSFIGENYFKDTACGRAHRDMMAVVSTASTLTQEVRIHHEEDRVSPDYLIIKLQNEIELYDDRKNQASVYLNPNFTLGAYEILNRA